MLPRDRPVVPAPESALPTSVKMIKVGIRDGTDKEETMAEAALFITWGQPVRGREKRANEQMRESVQYWKRLEDEGQIERCDWAAISGQGDLWGIALLRGTAEQIDSLRRSEGFGRNILRVSLVADRVAVADAAVDDGAIQGMKTWDEEIGALD
jgi:hypothetical protein